MMRELESRTFLTDLVDRIRSDQDGNIYFDPTTSPAAAFGKATLDAERAFQIGSLSIVDVPCWEAMGTAYIELSRLRTAMAGVSEMPVRRTSSNIWKTPGSLQAVHSVLSPIS
jgi:hypothetical protein